MSVWSDGTLARYPGNGNGTLRDSVPMWPDKSWKGSLRINAGDFNGDGHTDLTSIWEEGSLNLYRGQGNGAINSSTRMWVDNTWKK
ncbi:FG-GAP repeat domain-containing protein [Embleya scabrispora]|uniref:FG-GAP repeat domain-containing protein n=1 Tax=Embleya scabrispora TaxID=159449 RepID=UPI003CCC34CB